MALGLSPIRTETVSDKVVGQILDLVQSGELSVGDRLPGERQLADTLHVSRVPIREALSTLKALGIVEVRPGVGATITRSMSGALANEIWLRWLADHQSEIIKVYEVREAVECQATRLAAARARPEHLERLRAFLEEMEREVAARGYAALADLDRSFHEYVAGITGNELLIQFLRAINEISTLYRGATYRLPGRAESSLEEHREIVAAISSGDARRARDAAAQHTENIIELVKHNDLGPALRAGTEGHVRDAASAR